MSIARPDVITLEECSLDMVGPNIFVKILDSFAVFEVLWTLEKRIEEFLSSGLNVSFKHAEAAWISGALVVFRQSIVWETTRSGSSIVELRCRLPITPDY